MTCNAIDFFNLNSESALCAVKFKKIDSQTGDETPGSVSFMGIKDDKFEV